jgi:hypothetical protein
MPYSNHVFYVFYISSLFLPSGVYGFSAAKFTLTVAPVGQQIQLLAGQPQLSRTSDSYICSDRSAASGACLPSSTTKQMVQASSFSHYLPLSLNILLSFYFNILLSPISSPLISPISSPLSGASLLLRLPRGSTQ